ncbi:MAG: hypothetical protein ACJAZ2_001567 [Glaciecola sp.]|jgi:hypothetical protein
MNSLNLFATIVFSVLSIAVQSQQLDSLSFKRTDSTNTQSVESGQKMSITSCYADSNNFHHRKYMIGEFSHTSRDSIFLDVRMYRHTKFDMLDSNNNDYYSLFEVDYVQSGEVIQILKGYARNNICNISIDKFSNQRSILNLLTGIGLFNSLIVAPLVSINYKSGVFNSTRYYNYAATSLVGSVATFSISRLLLPKKYKFGSSEKKRYILD